MFGKNKKLRRKKIRRYWQLVVDASVAFGKLLVARYHEANQAYNQASKSANNIFNTAKIFLESQQQVAQLNEFAEKWGLPKIDYLQFQKHLMRLKCCDDWLAYLHKLYTNLYQGVIPKDEWWLQELPKQMPD